MSTTVDKFLLNIKFQNLKIVIRSVHLLTFRRNENQSVHWSSLEVVLHESGPKSDISGYLYWAIERKHAITLIWGAPTQNGSKTCPVPSGDGRHDSAETKHTATPVFKYGPSGTCPVSF